MVSKVFLTRLIDDPVEAAEDLASQVREMTLLANSVGLLMCYSDMEVEAFVQALDAQLPFEVLGCTTIASMDAAEGFHEMAAQLVVLTADDCSFGVGVSSAVVPGSVDACMAEAYAMATDGLDGAPKMLYVIPPYNLDIMLDDHTNALNNVAPNIPVLGGLPSYNGRGNNEVNATLYGGRMHTDRLVMMAIGGNLRPVFEIQNIAGSVVERKRKVTKAKGNTVYRVGNQRFTDYMKEIGFPMASLTGGNDTVIYVSNPLLLENFKLEDGQSFSFVRTLHAVDLEAGSGTAIGWIPEDATLSICALQRGDMATAAEAGMTNLKEKMKRYQALGYQYTTLLAVSCIGRYIVMLPYGGTEADKLREHLPEGMSFGGFYGYGEIGPLAFGEDQSIIFAHNESLVLCAL